MLAFSHQRGAILHSFSVDKENVDIWEEEGAEEGDELMGDDAAGDDDEQLDVDEKIKRQKEAEKTRQVPAWAAKSRPIQLRRCQLPASLSATQMRWQHRSLMVASCRASLSCLATTTTTGWSSP